MGETDKYKFGIKVDRQLEGFWSFGCCLSHSFGETYLFINFAVWIIVIGWLTKESEGCIVKKDMNTLKRLL